MKKVFAIAMAAIMMISLFAFSASAVEAGTFGSYEQAIIDLISAKQNVTVSTGTATFTIPANYVNQAKAYFAKTSEDVTKEEYDKVVAAVNDGKEKVKAAVVSNPTVIKNGQVDLGALPQEVKTEVLKDGQEACAVVELALTYNGKDVVIKENTTGAVVFENAPVVKTTGSNVNTTAMAVIASVFVALIAASVVTAKKVKLF